MDASQSKDASSAPAPTQTPSLPTPTLSEELTTLLADFKDLAELAEKLRRYKRYFVMLSNLGSDISKITQMRDEQQAKVEEKGAEIFPRYWKLADRSWASNCSEADYRKLNEMVQVYLDNREEIKVPWEKRES